MAPKQTPALAPEVVAELQILQIAFARVLCRILYNGSGVFARERPASSVTALGLWLTNAWRAFLLKEGFPLTTGLAAIMAKEDLARVTSTPARTAAALQDVGAMLEAEGDAPLASEIRAFLRVLATMAPATQDAFWLRQPPVAAWLVDPRANPPALAPQASGAQQEILAAAVSRRVVSPDTLQRALVAWVDRRPTMNVLKHHWDEAWKLDWEHKEDASPILAEDEAWLLVAAHALRTSGDGAPRPLRSWRKIVLAQLRDAESRGIAAARHLTGEAVQGVATDAPLTFEALETFGWVRDDERPVPPLPEVERLIARLPAIPHAAPTPLAAPAASALPQAVAPARRPRRGGSAQGRKAPGGAKAEERQRQTEMGALRSFIGVVTQHPSVNFRAAMACWARYTAPADRAWLLLRCGLVGEGPWWHSAPFANEACLLLAAGGSLAGDDAPYAAGDFDLADLLGRTVGRVPADTWLRLLASSSIAVESADRGDDGDEARGELQRILRGLEQFPDWLPTAAGLLPALHHPSRTLREWSQMALATALPDDSPHAGQPAAVLTLVAPPAGTAARAGTR